MEGFNKKKEGDPTLLDPKDKSQLERLHGFAKRFEEYINKVLREGNLSDEKFFLLISHWGISNQFCQLRYQKMAELIVRKLSRGRKNENCLCRCLKSTFTRWQKRWIVIGFNNVWYYEDFAKQGNQIRDNVPMDFSTEIEISGASKKYVEIDLLMNRRDIRIRAFDFTQGLSALGRIIKAVTCSHYTRRHKFMSFAPMRYHNSCEFYIRGEKYFQEAFRLMQSAQREILIEDWYLSPELPLVRPTKGNVDNEPSCLLNVLKSATQRGVRIYVLLYDEFNFGMYNSSDYAKEKLEAINPEMVRVIRHPKGLKAIYWSHHEKLIIIDRKTVMMGGLDLCWGRWDTDRPVKLFDYTKQTMFPGMDYYNPFKKEFEHGRDYKKMLIDEHYPRMPWQDIGIKLNGPIVFDFITHFVTYWNHAKEFCGEKEILMAQMYLASIG